MGIGLHARTLDIIQAAYQETQMPVRNEVVINVIWADEMITPKDHSTEACQAFRPSHSDTARRQHFASDGGGDFKVPALRQLELSCSIYHNTDSLSTVQDAEPLAMTSVPHLEIAEVRKDGRVLRFPRMINGLWQLAGGHDKTIEIARAASNMAPLISAGLSCFDMADHYGDAELVIGHHQASSDVPINAFTKWCPNKTDDKSFGQAEAAVDLARGRMNQEKIKLLQYHAWDYTDDAFLHNMDHLKSLCTRGKIEFLGLTNVDAAHLSLLLDSGFDIATNQVSCSVIDRRVETGPMSSVCAKNNVGILAYGTLLGGFISEKWLNQPEPTDQTGLNWSLRKYFRFIQVAGGWTAFQCVLRALAVIASKHRVSIPAVATRYVLDIPAVSAVIVGTRLSDESEKYIERNLAAFNFQLDAEDRALIADSQKTLKPIPGDCGDEYRRQPFLTAAGDLSDHLKPSDQQTKVSNAIAKGLRVEYSSGSKWEPIAGYCRALRTGNYIRVSGTTASCPIPSIPVVGGVSASSQTVAVLDIIERALKALGSSLADVVRTRVMIRSEADVDAISLAHGWAFQCRGVRPANTLIVSGLVGEEFLVEIEAEAEVGCSSVGVLTV